MHEHIAAELHIGEPVAPDTSPDELWQPVQHTDPAKKLAAMWLGMHYRDAHTGDEIEAFCWEILRPHAKPEPRTEPAGAGAASDGLIETLRLALDRTLGNFQYLLQGLPVRDAAETIAEANAALAAVEVRP